MRRALDAGRRAHLDIDLARWPSAGRPHRARHLSLLESGGHPVIRGRAHACWPAPVLVGVRPLFQGDYARQGSQRLSR